MEYEIANLYFVSEQRSINAEQILIELRKKYTGKSFHVFMHAKDNHGICRVDIRRDGTYSPAMLDNYTDVQWLCKTENEAKLTKEIFNRIL